MSSFFPVVSGGKISLTRSCHFAVAPMASRRISRITVKTSFLLGVYLLPLVVLVCFMTSVSVNTPIGDQWNLLSYFEIIEAGKETFSDLFKQHNEHRLFFPRLLFSRLAFLTSWNVRYEMAVSVFLAVITFIAIFLTSIRGLQANLFRNPAYFHLVNIFSGYAVFSLAQYDNWIWGFQVPWFLVNACLAWSVWILGETKVMPLYRLAVAAMLCCFASFSSAQGLFVWLAIIPAIWAIAGSAKRRAFRLVIWLLAFALCLSIYLIGYVTPYHAEGHYTKAVGTYLGHFLVSMGMPWLDGSANQWILIAAGALVVFSFLALFASGLWGLFKAKPETSAQAAGRRFALSAPWFSLGLYAIIFSLVNSYGRSGVAIGQARESRYTTSNLLIYIALFQLIPIFVSYWKIVVNKWLLTATVAFFTILYVNTAIHATEAAIFGEYGARYRRKQVVCIELSHYLSEQGLSECAQRNRSDGLAQLNQLGLRTSPDDLKIETALLSSAAGTASVSMSDLELEKDQVELSGRVTLSQGRSQRLRPTAILLKAEDEAAFLTADDLRFKAGRSKWQMSIKAELMQALETGVSFYLYYPEEEKLVQVEAAKPIADVQKTL